MSPGLPVAPHVVHTALVDTSSALAGVAVAMPPPIIAAAVATTTAILRVIALLTFSPFVARLLVPDGSISVLAPA
jgi:hypothetical protein